MLHARCQIPKQLIRRVFQMRVKYAATSALVWSRLCSKMGATASAPTVQTVAVPPSRYIKNESRLWPL
jgi:hypothetical protein